jgi:hypothetical protein
MTARPSHRFVHAMLALGLVAAALMLAACGGIGTKLQPPTAGIQQLTVQSNGAWVVVVRFQNESYNAGMHVYAIDAELRLNGKPAGHIAISPALDIPAATADIATAIFQPEAAGTAALTAAKSNAVRYELKGTLSAGRGNKGVPQSFPLHGSGYISPVPGVSNIWR